MRAARVNGTYQVFATEPVPPGHVVLVIDGTEVDQASRHSLQVDEHEHIEVVSELSEQELLDRHPWRFTNHSCDPNTRLSGRTLVAIRRIGAGEEVTFDYNTTEYELAEPFACHCGSAGCIGTVRGFKYLSAAERERLRPLLARHLHRTGGD